MEDEQMDLLLSLVKSHFYTVQEYKVPLLQTLLNRNLEAYLRRSIERFVRSVGVISLTHREVLGLGEAWALANPDQKPPRVPK